MQLYDLIKKPIRGINIVTANLEKLNMDEVKYGDMIGRGAYGEVFKVEYKSKIYALKKLPAENIETAIYEVYFAQMLSSYDWAPCIRGCHISSETSQITHIFLLFDFIQGNTVTHFISGFNRTTLSDKHVRNRYNRFMRAMWEQVVLILDILRVKKIAHFDIRQDNIMYCKINGVYKFYIIDFGVADLISQYRTFDPGFFPILGEHSNSLKDKMYDLTIPDDEHFLLNADMYSFSLMIVLINLQVYRRYDSTFTRFDNMIFEAQGILDKSIKQCNGACILASEYILQSRMSDIIATL